MNKDKRNNIQLLGTLNNADESGIIANANQVYDANEDKSTQDVSKEHKERIETLETKESSIQTTLENITKTGEASAASNVTYNHNDSQLDASNVQQAIDEVYSKGNTNRENDKTELEKSISDNKVAVDASIQDVYKKSNYNDGDNIIDFNTIHIITDNPEFVIAAVDVNDRILYGIKSNGQPYWGIGVPKVVRDYVDKQVNDILGTNNITETIDSLKEVEKFLSDFKNSDTLKALLDTKANKVDVVFDISAYHATGGTLATYADLTAALGTNGKNIPQSLRKGGMSVKFVQSSDNKYVQYRLMSDTFNTNVTDWQGVDDEPTPGSNNLVKSGGVAKNLEKISDIKKPVYPNLNEKISIEDDEDNEIVVIDKNGINAKNVKINGNELVLKNDVSEISSDPYKLSDEKIQITDNNDNILVTIDKTGLYANKLYQKNEQNEYIPVSFASKVLSLINIPYLFCVVNPELYSREYVVRVFGESYVDKKPTSPILLNGRRDCALSRQRKTDTLLETRTKQITLSADGYKNKTISQTFHCINEKVFNNCNIRLLLFGVSFDAIDYKNDDGTNEPGGTTTSALIEKYIRMGAEDIGVGRQYVSIGTCGHGLGDTFSYKNKSLQCRGKSEARGGNNGINYLRQPMHFSPDNIAYDPSVRGTIATGDVMWYMNGLRYRVPYNQEYTTSGTDYGEYERTTAKTSALRHTVFGKYHHDYSEILWEFCNKKGWITIVGGTYSAYTGSTEQKHIIDLCMSYIANNPEYPWYDITTARETSFDNNVIKSVDDNTQYSFNILTYLSRYRTMDDLGERLSSSSSNPSGEAVVGSDGKTYTIGTKITTQSMLLSCDVCKPTHIIWDMCYNDWPFYVNESRIEDSVYLSELFISIVKNQLGNNIIFGLKAKKENGSMFPDQWGDIALAQGFSPDNSFLTLYNKSIIAKYSDLSEDVSWIPIYPVSIPFATNFSQKFEDFVYGSCLVQSGDSFSDKSDVTHEGLRSAKAMAYQIYGWLGYSLIK